MGGEEKKFYSIIIKFTLPDAANKAVSRKVIFHRYNIATELYNRGARLRQYF